MGNVLEACENEYELRFVKVMNIDFDEFQSSECITVLKREKSG